MSFLERDEDLDAMLEEALAFIDECDSDGKPRSTRAGKKPSGCSAAAQRKAPKSNKTQRRVGDSQCYSTQLQQRKKAELRALRDQALELEQQVKLLLQRRQQRQQAEKNPKTQSQEDDSREWFKKAVGEFQRRQKAERTNRKLKEIWANQDKVNGAFRHLVQRRSLLYVGGYGIFYWVLFSSDWVLLTGGWVLLLAGQGGRVRGRGEHRHRELRGGPDHDHHLAAGEERREPVPGLGLGVPAGPAGLHLVQHEGQVQRRHERQLHRDRHHDARVVSAARGGGCGVEGPQREEPGSRTHLQLLDVLVAADPRTQTKLAGEELLGRAA
ncbi:hypothetical protein ON010_g1515 [Phytophthora cinnamomi]|nr:hypothetical protein ON010_g1515 [Phytophthora cinnamomi]